MDMEDIEVEDLVVQTSVESLMDGTPPEPDPMLILGSLVGCFENALD